MAGFTDERERITLKWDYPQYYSMVSKIWAIGKPSEDIALGYGKNVSKGIIAMATRISELECDLARARREKPCAKSR